VYDAHFLTEASGDIDITLYFSLSKVQRLPAHSLKPPARPILDVVFAPPHTGHVNHDIFWTNLITPKVTWI